MPSVVVDALPKQQSCADQKLVFETSMDISFSLSSQVHSTPVQTSKYARKAQKGPDTQHVLRSAGQNASPEILQASRRQEDGNISVLVLILNLKTH